MPSITSRAIDPWPLMPSGWMPFCSSGRLEHYGRGELSIANLSLWAARYPDEPSLVNGEFARIGLTLADLD